MELNKIMSKTKENRIHIGIFGRRNVGKSSFINAISGQSIAIVSDIAGTTTDPVKKSIELTGIGPVVLIDTAGIDDSGDLGKLRIEKTMLTLAEIDFAILMITENNFGDFEKMLIGKFIKSEIEYLIIHNKSDLYELNNDLKTSTKEYSDKDIIEYSAVKNTKNDYIINKIKIGLPEFAFKKHTLIGDLISYGDIVLLITPIDIEAPEGRMILPQVQAIRDILDNDAVAIVLKEREVDAFLKKTGIKPKLAITDSQIFLKADASVPKDIPLTGFSVVLARYKGDFDAYLEGTPKISDLKDGDRVLILESCSHHVACDDIGRVKIPRWINNFTGKKIEYDIVAGLDKLPRDIEDYSLVVQCGGCVITRKQIINRLNPAKKAFIPITNYGMAIAYIQGVYNRAIQPFVTQDRVEVDYL
jgi:[FeFe] hydrogenase H-cluster maturation GTPase HydF